MSVGNCKIYFVNGILNDQGCNVDTKASIEKIIQQKYSYRVPVDCRYNDTATSRRMIELADNIFDKQRAYDIWSKIQNDKEYIAGKLAISVVEFLNQDRLNRNRVGLILHSQGSDVGYRALLCLRQLSDRDYQNYND